MIILKKTCSQLSASAALAVWPLLMAVTLGVPAWAQPRDASDDSGNMPLVQPDELAAILRGGAKPLIIQVGFHVLYHNAHIPGSEYIGPSSSAEGLEKLRQRAQGLPRKQVIVLYCGCCPWEHCPNVHPAFDELRRMGFTNVRVLYIAQNFHTDWADKGYPVEKGD